MSSGVTIEYFKKFNKEELIQIIDYLVKRKNLASEVRAAIWYLYTEQVEALLDETDSINTKSPGNWARFDEVQKKIDRLEKERAKLLE